MSTSGRRPAARTVASTNPLPLFGVEIEIYVKIKPDLERRIRDRLRRDPRAVPLYWHDWDWNLENGTGNVEEKAKQRDCVGKAVREIIDIALGPGHGWTCESDSSLKEWLLKEPDEVRKWWGIEIISPPMSVTKHWQEEIKLIFAEVGANFDFWTNEFCACHVHVSPGPTKRDKYTKAQLVKMAKGAFFWETAFRELLPPERRDNRYALANHTLFASDEYKKVLTKGWEPVFSRLQSAASISQDNFILETKGNDNDQRYVSTSFHPFARLGTVELRRQAGVASAMTAIHRILFALTLHVSAFRYDFEGAKARRSYPDSGELIRELAGCIKKLPADTCHGSRFINFLYWCGESYAGNRCYTEKQINARERALREGIEPPNQRPSPAPAYPLISATAQRAPTPTALPSRPAQQPRGSANTSGSGGYRDSSPAPRSSSGGGGGGSYGNSGGYSEPPPRTTVIRDAPSRPSNVRAPPPPAPNQPTRRSESRSSNTRSSDGPRAIVRSVVGNRTVYEIR